MTVGMGHPERIQREASNSDELVTHGGQKKAFDS